MPESRRCVIVAAGPHCCPAFLRSQLFEDDYIIALDGGSLLLAAVGIRPHSVLGDLDSLNASTRAQLLGEASEVLVHPQEKEKTDAQLALELAAERGYTRVTMYAALGGRIDHTLANIQLVEAYHQKGMDLELVDERGWVRALGTGQHLEFPAAPGSVVSLIPLTPAVVGVSIRGLKYELTDAVLYRGDTLGISNAGLGQKARVTIGHGCVLITLLIPPSP